VEVPSLSKHCKRSLFPTRLGAGSLALLSTLSSVAVANPSLPVRITYAGDGHCVPAADFREAVRRKAPELHEAAAGEDAREFVVEVNVRADGTASGNVTISEPSGATATRRLEGDDCSEVTDALAFIVAELGRALRIDEGETAVVSPTPVAPSAAPRRASPESDQKLVAPPTLRLRWEAGVGIQAVRAPAPAWLVAPLAYLDLGWAQDRHEPLFSGRVSAFYAKSGTIPGNVGDAEIRWAAVRAELCGPHFTGGVFAASGCASFDAGVLEGRGTRAAEPKTDRAVWLSPGLTLRGHLTLVRTLVGGVEGGGFVPQVRPRFYFAGTGGERETVHEVPWVGFRVGLGLGVLFP
jgi:hypothetical protein